jgi:hypothetical protein
MTQKHWRPAVMAVVLARGPVIGVSLAITGVISILIVIRLALADATAMQVLQSQMAFTSQRFIDAIGPLGPDGIGGFADMTITLDFIYPVAYAVAIGGVWARLAGPRHWGRPALPLAAILVAAALDWIENLFHLAASAQMVDGLRPSLLFVLPGSISATAKWVLILTALLLTARAAIRRRGRVALVAIPVALLAGLFAGAVLAATI